MATKKGRIKYVPPQLLEAMEFTKKDKNIDSDAEAIHIIVEDAWIGREVQRIMENPIRVLTKPKKTKWKDML